MTGGKYESRCSPGGSSSNRIVFRGQDTVVTGHLASFGGRVVATETLLVHRGRRREIVERLDWLLAPAGDATVKLIMSSLRLPSAVHSRSCSREGHRRHSLRWPGGRQQSSLLLRDGDQMPGEAAGSHPTRPIGWSAVTSNIAMPFSWMMN